MKATLPFDILGLVAVQFLLMHFVELRRIQDWKKPGSVDQDPLFPGNKLPPHAVGYPVSARSCAALSAAAIRSHPDPCCRAAAAARLLRKPLGPPPPLLPAGRHLRPARLRQV